MPLIKFEVAASDCQPEERGMPHFKVERAVMETSDMDQAV